MLQVLRSGWLSTGAKCREFERAFARAVRARYAVALSSCTAALHLALEALGVGPGDVVLVPTMTFASTAAVPQHLGARVAFVDVNPHTLCVEPATVEEALVRLRQQGLRAKALVPVHFAGLACPMEALQELARAWGLYIVEDAAHAFGTTYGGRPVGSIGDITCFSFYATKNITTGEGGMATTEEPRWAERIRLMSLHGLSANAWQRYSMQGSWHYHVLAPGYKYNLSDVAAALGLAQLRRAEAMRRRRQEIARLYQQAFSHVQGLRTPPEAPPGDVHSWHLYVLKLRLRALRLNRDEFAHALQKRGIGVSVHFRPLHMQPYYQRAYGLRPQELPRAYWAFERIISLPIYSRMSHEDAHRVVEAVLEVLKEAAR